MGTGPDNRAKPIVQKWLASRMQIIKTRGTKLVHVADSIMEEVNKTYKNTVLPSYNNLKKSLKSSGIKWTSDNFIKICAFSASTTGVQIGLLGLTVPHALLASIGISLIASTVSYNENKAEKLRANHYTYLLSLKGEV